MTSFESKIGQLIVMSVACIIFISQKIFDSPASAVL